MTSGRNGNGNAETTTAAVSYRPTSIDFINRPNPVEPHAEPQKHPLHGTQRLDLSSHQDLRRLLLDTVPTGVTQEPLAKRQKTGDDRLLDLPKLPVRNSQARKPRLPPTLSGLHQPPPNAGLLPSINVEQPPHQSSQERSVPDPPSEQVPIAAKLCEASRAEATKPERKANKSTRRKWSDDETACLLRGVARFGIGNWTNILHCNDYCFNSRTALDLKDRFRVCRPSDYRRKDSHTAKPAESASSQQKLPFKPSKRLRQCKDRKNVSQLAQLGIKTPFLKSDRRDRHGYTSAEDFALQEGFTKHRKKNGKPAWISIQKDPELGLSHRTPTDLRDRFRNKWPEKYQAAGLAVRDEKLNRVSRNQPVESKDNMSDVPASNASTERAGTVKVAETNTATAPPKPQSTVKPPLPSLFSMDDAFFGDLFDENEADQERPILDRGILDWPADVVKQTALDTDRTDIEPLKTLLLPTPHPTVKPMASNAASGGSTALPSLATITASNADIDDASDQLELPSLAGYLGTLDSDTRPPSHTFLAFEDMLIS